MGERRDVGGSAKKVGLRIKELERLYGIEHGGDRKSKSNYSVLKSQSDIAAQMGISVDTLQNYKMVAEMIPELEGLVDTGIVTKTTALAIMKELSEEEQVELIAQLPSGEKFSARQIKELVAQVKSLKDENEKLKHMPVAVREVDNTNYELIDQMQDKIRNLTDRLNEANRMKKVYAEQAQKMDMDVRTLQNESRQNIKCLP